MNNWLAAAGRVGGAMLRASLLACAAVALASVAEAQDKWPSRRMTLVVPFGAGTVTDATARVLADQLKDVFGQPFIVENRAGAGGTLGRQRRREGCARRLHLLMAATRRSPPRRRCSRTCPTTRSRISRRSPASANSPSVFVDQPAAAVQDRAGVRGLCQGQSRQAHVRPRQQHRPHHLRDGQAAAQARYRAAALLLDARRDHRSPRQQHPNDGARLPHRDPADQGRQDRAAGRRPTRAQPAADARCRRSTRR